MERNQVIWAGQSEDEAYDGDEPLHAPVKCVVIGDTAVGKTRLICSHVYGHEGIPLELINSKPHLPTVFAIDQYMSEPVVRERARYIIDGVQVCLRIWDTFGDHDKNRKFAYQHAHVVVMCYSIGMPASLRNINAKWFTEIRKFCPRVPIILVGTQLDRRYIASNRFRTVGHARLRSYLAGHHEPTITQHQLVPPEIGRQTAREIGAYGYYETSIVTKFGVDDVFLNAIRAALVARRKSRPVLSSYLKRVQRPMLQEPYLPPKTQQPIAHVPNSKHLEEQASFYGDRELADVIFLAGSKQIYGHLFILVASSPVFAALFLNKSLLHSFHVVEDVSFLQSNTCKNNIVFEDGLINGVSCLLPRGFMSVDTLKDGSFGSCKVVVKISNMLAASFEKVLEFLYTGSVKEPCSLCDLIAVASLIQVPALMEYANNLLIKAEFQNSEVIRQFKIHFVTEIYRLFYNKNLFSDVTFIIEGTAIPAHKAALIPHCQVMAGMFRNGHFRESGTENVDFNDTNVESFLGVLEYIYTGNCSAVHMCDAFGILKLANFLCLPRLVAICEQFIIKDTEASVECNGEAVMDNIFDILGISQLHNARQLEAWCLFFMTTNYNKLCEKHAHKLKQMNVVALKYIEEHRWPPVWYLKEQDAYIKACKELENEKEKKMKSRRKRKCKSCF